MDSSSRAALSRTTILLLVADPLVRVVMEETLAREGYTVVIASDLGEAVDRLKEVSPDLFITRTYIRTMSGHDTAKYLRTKNAKMKVLLVGGLMDDERLHYRDSMQGFEVFPKAYTATEFLSKVAEVLNKPRG
jgi:CheY-like chemotaxis protein